MHEDTPRPQPRSRVKQRSYTWMYILGIFFLMVLFGYYFFAQSSSRDIASSTTETAGVEKHHPISDSQSEDHPTNETPATTGPLSDTATLGKSDADTPSDHDQITMGSGSPQKETPESSTPQNFLDTISRQDAAQDDSMVVSSPQPSGSAATLRSSEVQALIDELNAFYNHLDQQEYMQAFGLPEPSKAYFSKLIQKLIDRPPVITRETDDLFTLLKNTAHFFRVLGKQNIMILKGILDREKGSVESILKTFFALTAYPEALAQEYGIHLKPQSVYQYGSFFLNTMGGRLYLFRRDSKSRMVVSYYAIMAIERAKLQGHDRVGIDLLPAVTSLIDEIENGGRSLTFRENYLDSLYDLQEKYGRSG